MLRDPKILLHITWVISPARVPKGSYQKITHRNQPNRCTCIVHDEQDKRRFMKDIARTMQTARPGNIR
jgi:hypothetical protein